MKKVPFRIGRRKKPVIGIIVNPYSRKNIRTNCESVRTFQKVGGSKVDVRATESLEHLDQVVHEFREEGYPYIGISGGDGTIHNVISRVINIYMPDPPPPLLLLNDGTMNNIASSVGLKGESAHILERFLYYLTQWYYPRMVQRDTIKIDDKYCFLFGFGTTSRFLNECYSDGKGFRQNIQAFGKTFGEVLHSIMTIKNQADLSVLKTMDAEILINSRKINFHKVLLVIAGTVENIGMGFRTLYRANDVPGHFHCLVNGMKPVDIVTHLPKFAAGHRVESNLNVDEVIRKLEVKADGKFEYTMDGDMYVAHERLIVETGVPVRLIVV